MNSEIENLDNLLIDYIDGKLNDSDKERIERELVNNANSYKRYEQLKKVIHEINKAGQLSPTDKLKPNFDKLLKEEISPQSKSKTVFFRPSWYQMAAAVALLIVGGGVGYLISNRQKHNVELTELRKEVELTRQHMLAQLGDNQSPSQRMLGVKAAYESVEENNPDDEIVNVLVKRMNEDINSNVRLAAIDALSRFTHEEKVRSALIASLTKQIDPIVQLALIQLLVEMKEKKAIKSLQLIIDDDTSIPAVKDEAYAGLFKLS